MITDTPGIRHFIVVGDESSLLRAGISKDPGCTIEFVSTLEEAVARRALENNSKIIVDPSSRHGLDFEILSLQSNDESGIELTQDALKKSNQRLELLSDTVSRLLLSEDPQGLVQELCEKVMEFLDCHTFFNYLVDEGRNCLHLNAYAGIPAEIGRSIEWLDYGAAVCGCAARDGCRIVAENIPETPDPRTDLVKGFGIKAYACHPLLSQGDQVIGTLSFGTRSRIAFSDDDLSLMKTVADHVVTAMERIRLLNVEKERAEAFAESEARLRMALDSTQLGTWDHDLITDKIIWSSRCKEIFGLPESAEIDSAKFWACIHPEDKAHLQAIISQVTNPSEPIDMSIEYRVIWPDGTIHWISARGSAVFGEVDGRRCAMRLIGTTLDITQRKLAKDQEAELEEHKRDFYRRTILAATDGKLAISERNEIDQTAGELIGSWEIHCLQDMTDVRETISQIVCDAGLNDEKNNGFIGCIVEANANALKHANGGSASLHRIKNGLRYIISDSGKGIDALALPDVALTKGYSTTATLGMGYKVMLAFADKVHLATGPEGTTVAIDVMQDISPVPNAI